VASQGGARMATALLSQDACFSESGSSPPRSRRPLASRGKRSNLAPAAVAFGVLKSASVCAPLHQARTPTRHFRVTTGAISLLLGLTTLNGCAATWKRPDAPLSQQARDEAECQMESNRIQPHSGGFGGLAGALMLASGIAAQKEIFDNCMTAKGYVKE
jgi:hypothetical protein